MSLPAKRTFLVRLSDEADPEKGLYCGRVEHTQSGQPTRFLSERSLRGFPTTILLELLVWINRPEQRGQVQHDLLVEIDQCFREQGIEIPFPQRDLHVKSPVEPDVTGS